MDQFTEFFYGTVTGQGDNPESIRVLTDDGKGAVSNGSSRPKDRNIFLTSHPSKMR